MFVSFVPMCFVSASNSTVDALYSSLETKYQTLTLEQQQIKWMGIKKVLEVLGKRYPKLNDITTLLIAKINIKTSTFSSYDENNLDELAKIRQEMLVLVNKEREKMWLDFLIQNSLLDKSAQLHADYMNTTDDFNHVTKDWISPVTRIENVWYKWIYLWENIAWNQRSVPEVVEWRMNSQGHKENILSKNFKEIGIWFKNYYWVQNFGWY